MKNSYFFPHDYHARHDPKIEKLMLDQGCEGIGIYWCLIEMLYEQGGSLPLIDIPLYAKSLNITEEKLNHTLEVANLFKKNSTHFYSLSQKKRMKEIKERSEKARESAKVRWSANAMRTQCEGNAIKEVKEVNKRKEVEVKQTHTATPSFLIEKNESQHLTAEHQPLKTDIRLDALRKRVGIL